MFKKEKKSFPKTSDLETIIGPSVKVRGRLIGQGNVQIEGVINGGLEAAGDIKIGEKAKVQAEIKGRNIFVAGVIKGGIKAKEKVVLKSTAKVIGDIETKSISIEEGAFFQGKCLMNPEEKESQIPSKKQNTKINKENKNSPAQK